MSVVQQLSSGRDSVTAAVRRAAGVTSPALRRVRPVGGVVSGTGWTVLAGGVGCWVLGWRFGWVELMLLATAAVVLFAACALLTIGRTRLRVEVAVDPERVVVGGAATGVVRVVNEARGVLLPIMLELPIGASAARFTLPTLRHGVAHEELFVVPTDRRGVIPIGPATTVRGDPLGLMRRTVAWTRVTELFVHPRTVALEPLGAGLLRDLEGQTTNDVSMSDLAFHALRDYAPGDDRRYIHWRSSAKAGRFLVRQFLDTRRSHFTTVVDSSTASYADAEDYETAISVAASIAVRAVLDEQEVTVVAGAHALPAAPGIRVLDTFSRADLGEHGLTDLAVRASRIATDTSVALLVTGSRASFADLHRAAVHFPPEVSVVGIQVDPSRPTSVSTTTRLVVLSVQTLSELPALLAGALT